jgi:hypothetical protein
VCIQNSHVERSFCFHKISKTKIANIRLSEAVPGKFLSIVGQDPSDIKSDRLHVRHHLLVLLSFI